MSESISLDETKRRLRQIRDLAAHLVALADEFDCDPTIVCEAMEPLADAWDDFCRWSAGEEHLCRWSLHCERAWPHEGQPHQMTRVDGSVQQWEA